MKDFKFLHNKRSTHYALIIDETDLEYFYLTLTHSLKYGIYDNLKLFKNPNLKDERDAYIIPKIYKLNKSYFKDTANHLVLSEEDKAQVIELIERKQKLMEEKSKSQQQHEEQSQEEIKEQKEKSKNTEEKSMNKKETKIKEEKEETMANEKDAKENIFFQIDPSQILESSESDKKNHLMKISFPKGSKYEGYIAVLPDYCNRGFNKFKTDKIDIMLTPKTKPFMYINNVKATEIAKLLDSNHDFNKRVFNLTDNQCVVQPNQVLHKTDKSYIIGFPEGSKYENAVKAIVPIKNVQEFKGDGKLKLTISINQVLQVKNTLSNEFLAKALRDRGKTNEKALDNKETTREPIKQEKQVKKELKKETVKELEKER